MLPIQILNGVASIALNKTRKLTARQLTTLKNMSEDRAARYLWSLLGITKERVSVHRVQTNMRDRLAAKEPGSYSRRFEALLNNTDETMHRPSQRNLGQWVGVEIECYYPSDRECTDDCDHDNGECHAEHTPSEDTAHARVRDALKKAGVPRCSVKYDGSLESDEGVGVEVTILFNTADGFEPLNKLCRVLNSLGCFVNDRCGLHVHLDCRHLKPKGVKLIGRRLGRALPVLKYMVDSTRHGNHYCKLEVSPFSREHDDRYYAVNMTAFYRYKTIEVRLHGGSTNQHKIRNWIETLQFIGSNPIKKSFATFQDFIDLGIPEHLVEYADKRINRLNPGAWAILCPVTAPAPQGEVAPQTAIPEGGPVNGTV